jgi:hypothetical protein
MKPRQEAAKKLLEAQDRDDAIRADQMRRGKLADRRHAKIDSTEYEDSGRGDRKRERDLRRANEPTDALQSGRELAPVASQGEGFLHDVDTRVYQGDSDFMPNYKNQVLAQRDRASERDAAAFARANAGLDPTTGEYTASGQQIRRPIDHSVRGVSKFRTYPGRRLTQEELDAAPAGSQSEWGTRAPLKK